MAPSPNQRSASAPLDVIRPIVARLDVSRHSEDVAADLLEAWSGVETALRSLIGGSSASGQALVAELRQRQQLSLDQAHALLEFLAARDRAARPEYRPTGADVTAARQAVQKLEAGLGAGGLATVPVPAATAFALDDAGAPAPVPSGVVPRGSRWMYALALVALVALPLAGFLWYANRGGAMDRGVEAYQAGRREAARGEFAKVARDKPELAMPHVYLGRLAREENDLATAKRELETAIRLEPTNAVAQREMGKVLLALGDNELARRFLVRAVQLAPEDRSAQGFLGCALFRLGRLDEAARFINRAGTGDWTGCAPPPGAFPPPQRAPPGAGSMRGP